MKGILFDLDGTLLPINTEQFLEEYLKLLAPKVIEHMDPQVFCQHLLAATAAMIKNDDADMTNEQVFMEDFFNRVNVPKEKLLPIFEEFYAKDFKKLAKCTKAAATSKELVEELAKRDVKLVLATNPLFPLVAIEERLSWLDIDPSLFSLITSYENMHFCKPNINYYREIIEKCSLNPEESIMIGNDQGEDMIAKKLGMKGYLVTDYLIPLKEDQEDIQPDWQGNFKELKDYLLLKL